MLDFYSLDEDMQQKIIEDMSDAVTVTIEQCHDQDTIDRYSYYLNNEDYELSVTFFDTYDHDLLDEYVFTNNVEERNVIFGQMSFAPAGEEEPLDHDLIHVAYIVYDLDDDEDNASTVILCLQERAVVDIEQLDKAYRMELLRQINTYVRESILQCPDKSLKNRYVRMLEDGRFFISITYLRDIDYTFFNSVSKEDNFEAEDIVCGYAIFEPIPGKGGQGVTTIAGFIYDLTKDRPESEQIRHCKIVMTKGSPFKAVW